MTAVEKAHELVYKMYDEMFYYRDGYSSSDAIGAAKKCALIAVDEILEVLYSLKLGNALSEELEYWEEVKQEIPKQ